MKDNQKQTDDRNILKADILAVRLQLEKLEKRLVDLEEADATESQEALQERFNQRFRELLSNTTIRFINKHGGKSDHATCCYDLLDGNGDWLFSVNYGKDRYFWYSFDRVHEKLTAEFGDNIQKIRELMSHILDEDFNLNGVTPEGY